MFWAGWLVYPGIAPGMPGIYMPIGNPIAAMLVRSGIWNTG